MPWQDIALYDLFTIQETLYYFGTLNGMKSRDIMVETGAFIEFLDLPNQSRRVGAMRCANFVHPIDNCQYIINGEW
jgi:ABC-type uncharacterized transport system ATPase subunit